MFKVITLCLYFTSTYHTNAFVMDTNFGKFLQTAISKEDENTVASAVEYAKLDENTIISAFQGFRQIVDDPMIISEQKMNYIIPDIIRTEGVVRKLSVFHLKNATLDHVFIAHDDGYGELQITFPLLTVSGLYNMTFSVDRHNISVYGNGSFSLQFENLQIRLNVTLERDAAAAAAAETNTKLRNIDWNQTLAGVKIEIKNLLDDQEASSMFSENLSAIIPSLHRTYKPMIDEFMSRAVTVYCKVLFSKSNKTSSGLNLQTLVRVLVKQASIPNASN